MRTEINKVAGLSDASKEMTCNEGCRVRALNLITKQSSRRYTDITDNSEVGRPGQVRFYNRINSFVQSKGARSYNKKPKPRPAASRTTRRSRR